MGEEVQDKACDYWNGKALCQDLLNALLCAYFCLLRLMRHLSFVCFI